MTGSLLIDAEPEQVQPPLTWWSHTWRYLVSLAISVVAVTSASERFDSRWWWVLVDPALGLAGFVMVWFRRRWPLQVATITAVMSGVSLSVAGPAALALMSLATHRRWRQLALVGAISLCAVVTVTLLGTGTRGWTELAIEVGIGLPVIAATIAWGMYIGSRRALIANLRERARRAESEQAARVQQARGAERQRIAREMHDVVAHRISLVTMHADAMVYRDDLSTDQLRDSARVIQDSSHRALVELREVLGVLRDDPGDAQPEGPQPAAPDVLTLVDQANRDGMSVELTCHADLVAVPDSIGRTLYRAAQEALTNARKHAPQARVRLRIEGAPGEGLVMEARNPPGFEPGTAPVSGLGLVGLAERASLAGGRATHSMSGAGDFVLSVWLPWPDDPLVARR